MSLDKAMIFCLQMLLGHTRVAKQARQIFQFHCWWGTRCLRALKQMTDWMSL